MRRRLAVAVAVMLALTVIAVAGAGWHYSEQILTPGGGALEPERVRVVAAGDDAVVLESTAASTRPGHFGLRLEDDPAGLQAEAGYALAGPPSALGPATVRRPVEWVAGNPTEAHSVVFDNAYFPADPTMAFDFPLAEVQIPAEVGPLPAYLDDQRSDTWVVFVHGRGSDRREGFRLLSAMHEMGLSTLLISYRNDAVAPARAGGRYGLGSTEWRDLQAAVRYAARAGAEQVVLAGASTGGAIVGAFLDRAPESDMVAGAVLDSPVLDWGPVLRLAARQRGLPTWLTGVAMTVAELRGIPWAELNQLRRAQELQIPVLIFHGAQDTTVPLATSQQLAAARPDLVTLAVAAQAEHMQAWNVDPVAYDRALGAFLTALPGLHLEARDEEARDEVLSPAA